uniref:Uncharacterized protein n=1 Tax=Rhizophora mucronata TaxID=61149 RepID=A0A2P2MX58_RHIMU
MHTKLFRHVAQVGWEAVHSLTLLCSSLPFQSTRILNYQINRNYNSMKYIMTLSIIEAVDFVSSKYEFYFY